VEKLIEAARKLGRNGARDATTFEMVPRLYSVRWIPAIIIGVWWFAVMAAIGLLQKQLGYKGCAPSRTKPPGLRLVERRLVRKDALSSSWEKPQANSTRHEGLLISGHPRFEPWCAHHSHQ
jgi:hypothetical protein